MHLFDRQWGSALARLRAVYAGPKVAVALEREIELARRTLEELGAGIVVLTPGAMVRLASPRARALVARHFGDSPSAARLPAPLERWVREELARHAPRDPGAQLVVEARGRRLVARLLVVGTDVVVVLREWSTRVRAETLRRLGLTAREAEVLACVADGKTNEGAARLLGLARRTVHKHLQHVYAKLGVHGRAMAVVRAREAAARWPGEGGR